MGSRWFNFWLDYRPHNGHGFIPHRSFERTHNRSYKAKKRAAKTLKHYVVKPGRYGSPSWRYTYAYICHNWFLFITSSFVWVYLYVICGESFLQAFTLYSYYAPLDYHCLGEVRGDTKMEGIQAYHHKWPGQKDCDRYLALCALPNSCNLYHDYGLCGSRNHGAHFDRVDCCRSCLLISCCIFFMERFTLEYAIVNQTESLKSAF